MTLYTIASGVSTSLSTQINENIKHVRNLTAIGVGSNSASGTTDSGVWKTVATVVTPTALYSNHPFMFDGTAFYDDADASSPNCRLYNLSTSSVVTSNQTNYQIQDNNGDSPVTYMLWASATFASGVSNSIALQISATIGTTSGGWNGAGKLRVDSWE